MSGFITLQEAARRADVSYVSAVSYKKKGLLANYTNESVSEEEIPSRKIRFMPEVVELLKELKEEGLARRGHKKNTGNNGVKDMADRMVLENDFGDDVV